jgi:glutamine---fructose-6-phosphate transaminase (isomerizing)
MHRCKSCLLPNTYPMIQFDDDGICNNCRNYIPEKYERKEEFDELLHLAKEKNEKYDCLIGLSGGRDSSYLAYKIVRELGLHPLAYSYDNGHMPDSAKNNIKKITEVLGIETIIIDDEAPRNRELFKRLFLAWAKKPSLGMIQAFCIGCRGGINKNAPKMLEKYGIKYLIDGANYLEKTSYKLGFLGIEKDDFSTFEPSRKDHFQIKCSLAFCIIKEIAKNPSYASIPIIRNGLKDYLDGFGKNQNAIKIQPFMFEKYDEKKVLDIITNELGWETPTYFPVPWRADCTVAMLKNYCYLKMVGFSDYDCALSNMIREKSIDRETALCRIEKFNSVLNPDLVNCILKSKGIDPNILHNAIDSWKNSNDLTRFR